MSDLKGYAGQLLDVDLTSGTTSVVPLDPEIARQYIGGRSLGIRLIMEEYGENYADIDPLGPEAVLGIFTGPFAAYGGAKTMACFKSPQNGAMFGSAVSGDTAAALRFAGYDGILIRGAASKPVYLYIENDTVEIREAQHLWGMTIPDTHKYLDKETPLRTEHLYIGPGGENLVKFAALMSAWYRAAGRGGPGAVMGSKNLKAISIQGTGPAPEVADMDTLMSYINGTADKNILSRMRDYGTAGGIFTTGNRQSSEPVKNWQSEWHNHSEISGQYLAADMWVRRHWGDYGCNASCSKLGRIQSGTYAGAVAELPDYEGGAYMGPNLEVYDIGGMSFLADLADQVGLDVIEAGNVLGFAAELYDREILTAEDFDLGEDAEGEPLVPAWGNAPAFEVLMNKIARREGDVANTLADGVYPAAQAFGEETMAYAVHVKAIAVGAHGVRSGKDFLTMGGPLAYGLQTQGGDHCSTVAGVESYTELSLVNDAVGNCLFWMTSINDETSTQSTLGWLNAITGFGVTEEELLNEMSPRWINLQRASIVAAGWAGPEGDRNPDRFYEPLPEGPDAGKKIDPAVEADVMQQAYAFRGWDENGVPTTETLEKYDLAFLDPIVAGMRA